MCAIPASRAEVTRATERLPGLWIVEDNDFSDIWVAESDLDQNGSADDVKLFASLKDSGAEDTGIYFGKDPKTLFVNIQHPDKALADGTWKISHR